MGNPINCHVQTVNTATTDGGRKESVKCIPYVGLYILLMVTEITAFLVLFAACMVLVLTGLRCWQLLILLVAIFILVFSTFWLQWKAITGSGLMSACICVLMHSFFLFAICSLLPLMDTGGEWIAARVMIAVQMFKILSVICVAREQFGQNRTESEDLHDF